MFGGNRKESPLRGPKGQPRVEGRLGRVWQLRPTPSASFAGMTRWLGKGRRRKSTQWKCLLSNSYDFIRFIAVCPNWDSNSHSFCITHG
jgi:hypothetical protein